MTFFAKKDRSSRAEQYIAEALRIIGDAEADGEEARRSSSSRSTGYRAQYKRSHDGLQKVAGLLRSY